MQRTSAPRIGLLRIARAFGRNARAFFRRTTNPRPDTAAPRPQRTPARGHGRSRRPQAAGASPAKRKIYYERIFKYKRPTVYSSGVGAGGACFVRFSVLDKISVLSSFRFFLRSADAEHGTRHGTTKRRSTAKHSATGERGSAV